MNHKSWFRVWQDQLFSNPRFLHLSLEAKGLLLLCWGMTNREGGKKCPLDVPAMSRWCNHVCNSDRGNTGQTFELSDQDSCFNEILSELINGQWIEVLDDGKSFISRDWDKWQDKAYEAWKKKEQRKNRVPKMSRKCPPKEEEKEEEKENPIVPKGTDSKFEQFWKAYPRKVGKGAAEKAFQRNVNGLPVETLLSAIQRDRATEQWRKDGGQFIPHPATWLNQRRWEDEPEGLFNGKPKSEPLKAPEGDPLDRIDRELGIGKYKKP